MVGFIKSTIYIGDNMCIIDDKRSDKEKKATIGFVVANDKFMSGWGLAPGRSIVACAFHNKKDEEEVYYHFLNKRPEMKYLRVVYGKTYTPRMKDGDHLSIYGFNDFRF